MFSKKSLVIGEDAFALRDFPELTMVVFDYVGGVNNLPDLRRLFKEGRRLGPVAFPRLGDQWILGAPFLAERL